MTGEPPSVAVVITTHDEEPGFLREAVESVHAQTLAPDEIVIVDDGSRFDTASEFTRLPRVRLIRQDNHGLAAARNAGWRAATSTYVVFLDADDRLAPEALEANLQRFRAAPECALVYGAYRFIDRDGRRMQDAVFREIGSDPYATLLRGNAIGMHAAVMYRRDRLADVGGFDTSYRACEDYDVYLRLARHHPIASGPETIAEYRQHDCNMSLDVSLMLRFALRALQGQRPHVCQRETWRRAYEEGLRSWRSHYVQQHLSSLRESVRQRGVGGVSIPDTLRVLAAAPGTMLGALLRALRSRLPRRSLDFGALGRTTPISRHFGYDRGTPIDRHYIEDFLRSHASDIRGRVLEIGDNAYTRAFGGDRVVKSDVLHVDAAAPSATFVADLQHGGGLPSDAFDCVILTQTLHLIFELPKAIEVLHRILKSSGVLLATVPGVSSVDAGEWGGTWFWSLTPASLDRLLRQRFAAGEVEVAARGNVLTAIAFLHGLAQHELRPADFEVVDPQYPVIVTARATKAKHAAAAE